jgi:signal transduction histidine kinase
MRERSHALKGKLSVSSRPDRGTTVRLSAPVGEPNGDTT